MVLIGFARVAISEHSLVGQKLQILPHFAAQVPHDRVQPAQDGVQFCKQDIVRMTLRHMHPLMLQHLVQAIIVHQRAIYEYPSEKRKRTAFARQHPHLTGTYPADSGTVHQKADRPYLHQHAYSQHRHTCQIEAPQPVCPHHARFFMGIDGDGWQHHGGVSLDHALHATILPPCRRQYQQRDEQRKHTDGHE